MIRTLTAAALYFLLVFVVGFCLGALRVILIAPRLGDLAATLIELPVMLTIGWFACRTVIRWLNVLPRPLHRWAMVLCFLVLLVLFEWQLGERLFGRNASDQWAALITPAGIAGLAGQFTTALFPVLQGRTRT